MLVAAVCVAWVEGARPLKISQCLLISFSPYEGSGQLNHSSKTKCLRDYFAIPNQGFWSSDNDRGIRSLDKQKTRQTVPAC